jgi:hypothetical protein
MKMKNLALALLALFGLSSIAHAQSAGWEFPTVSTYAASNSDNGKVIGSDNVPGANLTVTLPSSGISAGWTLAFSEAGAHGFFINAPGSVYILSGQKTSTSLTIPSNTNYEYMVLEYDGTNFRLTGVTPKTALANGLTPGSGVWIYLASTGFPGTVADNGSQLTSSFAGGNVTYTTPPTGLIPNGWSVNLLAAGGNSITVQPNSVSGGTLLDFRNISVSSFVIPSGMQVQLSFDGASFHVTNVTTGTVASGIYGASSLGVPQWLPGFEVSVTDPTVQQAQPAFSYPSSTLTTPGAAYLDVTWDSSAAELGYSLSVQSTVNAGSIVNNGAVGAITAGTLVLTTVAPDGATITTVINPGTETVAAGSALWSIVRGENIYSSGNTVDAFRISNESSNSGLSAQNPRSGLYIFNDLSYNAFYAGIEVASATEFGIVVGYPATVSSVIVPAYPFAFLNGSSTPYWDVDSNGDQAMVGSLYLVGDAEVEFYTGAGDTFVAQQISTGFQIVNQSAVTIPFKILNSGNVNFLDSITAGSGTALAYATVDVYGPTQAATLIYHSPGDFAFENATYGELAGAFNSAGAAWLQTRNLSSAAEPLLLNPLGGDVGIGTATPSQVLEVNGTIKADTGIILSGSPPSSGTGLITIGGTIVAASNCGSVAGSVGCVEMGIGGGLHYAPYW